MYTPILPEALFTIAKIWKQPVSTEGWMDKEDMIHTHTHTHYYSAIKKDEILPLKTTWMDLENTMLSEIRQTEKDK